MFTVVLDACVLVPPTLTDTMLRIAETGSFGVRWSESILAEVGNVMERRGVTNAKRARRLDAMRSAFPHASVDGFEPLIGVLTNDPKDRHVLAAAIRSECHTIVTFNLRDFPEASLEPWDVEVLHPDTFLVNQLDLAPGNVMEALAVQTAAYANPPMTVEDLLGRLARCGVPTFADECRRHLRPAR